MKNFVNGQITLNIGALTNLNAREIEEKIINTIQLTLNSVGADLETLGLDIESVESMNIQVVDAQTGKEVYEEVTI
ncbi:hypothetical protein ABFV99_00430 [Cytobacillus horneckiae]|uniref:hypothetical protein n=1 Tax=Cytobacillus horneckiae TaxID=549687 RepID=UPI0034CDC472